MESNWELKNIVDELKNGKNLTTKLQNLNSPSSSSSSSRETPELMLVEKIISSFDKALFLLNFNTFSTPTHSLLYPPGITTGVSDSPSLFSGDSDQDHDPKNASRKRKSIARWKEQVRVNPGMGIEGTLDDGYNWRKYGQKDILGAKFPRGYYRCTHRIIEGCLATKQVQRSDEDPFIFDITYYRKHTCTQNSDIFSPSQPPENQEPPIRTGAEPKEPQENHQELLFSIHSSLKVMTEDLDSRPDQSFSSSGFQFTSTSDVLKADNQSQLFSTNYFSGSSSIYGGNQNFQTCEPMTTTTSPSVALDFPFDNVEFEPSFLFDNSSFLP